MEENEFYLGTDNPTWLWRLQVPLFVSHQRLKVRKKLKESSCDWALDSGAFTVVNRDGCWRESPKDYAQAVKRYSENVGHMRFCVIQDWMCENFVLGKTGLDVYRHQQLTVASFLELKSLEPNLPWMAILQGHTSEEYMECFALYEKAGVDLSKESRVGIGSVCRRQRDSEIIGVVAAVARLGVRLHGFGVKLSGLPVLRHYLFSSDSMAWCYTAWRNGTLLPECQAEIAMGLARSKKNCAHCERYALRWREKALRAIRGEPMGPPVGMENGK